jgi:hypothetical protein
VDNSPDATEPSSGAAREFREKAIETDESIDDFLDSYYKYYKMGVERGAAQNQAKCLLKVFEERRLKLTEENRARITADAGLAKLERWFDRAMATATAIYVFADDED